MCREWDIEKVVVIQSWHSRVGLSPDKGHLKELIWLFHSAKPTDTQGANRTWWWSRLHSDVRRLIKWCWTFTTIRELEGDFPSTEQYCSSNSSKQCPRSWRTNFYKPQSFGYFSPSAYKSFESKMLWFFLKFSIWLKLSTLQSSCLSVRDDHNWWKSQLFSFIHCQSPPCQLFPPFSLGSQHF